MGRRVPSPSFTQQNSYFVNFKVFKRKSSYTECELCIAAILNKTIGDNVTSLFPEKSDTGTALEYDSHEIYAFEYSVLSTLNFIIVKKIRPIVLK